MAAELFMGSHLTIEGDYLNLVNQVCDMNGFLDWEIEGEVNTIRQLLKANANWSIEWILHEGNVAAYNLAIGVLTILFLGEICVEGLPYDVKDCDHAALLSLPIL